MLRTKPESVAPAVARWQTSRTERASRSVQPFLYGSPVYPHTDTQTTERATRVAVVRLYAMLACMRCGLIIIGRIYLCRECCSRCRFQPYDCMRHHPVRGVDSVHLQILLMGTCRQCMWFIVGRWSQSQKGDWARPICAS